MSVRVTEVQVNELPIEESRQLVAVRTGTLGYPDSHAIAVATCALRIAERLALASDLCKTIASGALLHDVGKLAVPEEILMKPGPLTTEERRQVRQHPEEGERIIRTAVPSSVAEVVLAHHERWDGAGYPFGLRGNDIPLPARVVSVADAYLAMRESRPYRDQLSEPAAIAELTGCAGSQFDPACVEALVGSVRQADD